MIHTPREVWCVYADSHIGLTNTGNRCYPGLEIVSNKRGRGGLTMAGLAPPGGQARHNERYCADVVVVRGLKNSGITNVKSALLTLSTA